METRRKGNKSPLPPMSNLANQASQICAGRADYSRLSEEGRTLLALIDERFDEIKATIKRKDEKIDELEDIVSSMRIEIDKLHVKLEDVETESRATSVIISGNSMPSESQGENCINTACEVIKRELKYELSPDVVSNGHRIGRRSEDRTSDKRAILLKLKNQDDKRDLLVACKTSKPPNLFINESLVPRRSHVLYLLRQAKRRFPKIAACGSHNGRVFVYLKSTTPSERNSKMFINTVEELNSWALRVLGVTLDGEVSDTRQ